MELLFFRKDFLESVKSIAAVEKDFEEAAFITVASDKLIEAEEIADFEHCFYEGTGKRNRRLRVDGFSFDDVDDSVTLVISGYSGGVELDTLIQTEADRLFDRLQAFAEESLGGRLYHDLEQSSPSYGLANELFHRSEALRTIKLYLITDKVLSQRIKDMPNGELLGKRIEYHIWDISRFHRVFESTTGRDTLHIDFSELIPDGIPCLEAAKADGDYEAYLCIIPGEILANIYNRYGSRLLEGNVRSFLSTKMKVNKGIRTTILSNPSMFFAYNNGIAATATDAQIEMTNAGLRVVQCTDLQIVNGGQTTASLLMAKLKDKADLSKVSVQMKLSVISPDKAESIIPDISRYANSQNKISEADFFSNHPFHIRIEAISRRLWAPAVGGGQHETHWFYERARGQHLNEQAKVSSSEQKKFVNQNPRNQVITKTDLAKYHNTWRGLPHTVSLGAQKNFTSYADWIAKRWEESEVDFNEEFFREVVALAILFKHTERLVSNQPWYEGGYRANIVTYTLAKLAHDIKKYRKGKVLDFRLLWSRQDVPEGLSQQLAVTTQQVATAIVKPDPGYQNVTEWAKRERCWENVQELDISLVYGLDDCLVDTSDAKAAAKESKQQQKVDNGIDAQIQVVQAGPDYWKRMMVWARQHKLVTPDEDRLLSVASKGGMPTDWQSKKLLVVRERVNGEGFLG